MKTNYQQIAIALAGIIQATGLVRQLAQKGKIQEELFHTSIYSLFQTDTEDLQAIYGDINSITWGLGKLIDQMSSTPDRILSRYMLSVIHLQKKIHRSKRQSNYLDTRLTQIKKQVDYFHLTHPLVISNLADIYLTTINSFNFRLIIWGNQRILRAESNMEKMRALLLAAIRSAGLWRQAGGSRWQFLFARAKIREAAQELLTDSLTNLIERNTK